MYVRAHTRACGVVVHRGQRHLGSQAVCESPDIGCWELSSSSLQEQYALLPPESSLQTPELEFLFIIVRNIRWYSCYLKTTTTKQFDSSSKTKIESHVLSSNSASRRMPWRTESKVLKMYLFTYFHNSITHSGEI